MPSSMEERPAFARSSTSLLTIHSTMTSSHYDAGSRTSASRDRPASQRGQQPLTAPTPSASSHATKIFRMLVGERRSADDHEHQAAQPRARESDRCVQLPLGMAGVMLTSCSASLETPQNRLRSMGGVHGISECARFTLFLLIFLFYTSSLGYCACDWCCWSFHLLIGSSGELWNSRRAGPRLRTPLCILFIPSKAVSILCVL